MEPDSELTCAEVGATAYAAMPVGHHHLEVNRRIGSGRACFATARQDLFDWQVQRRAGLEVDAEAPITLGQNADLLLRMGLWRVRAPVRVVSVIDEPRKAGFAYATRVGHPESGEELFTVHLGTDGEVTFRIRAFSRPVSLLARLGGPLTLAVQRRITQRYLAALDHSR